ncbi:MAG TPA: SDR family NAD(P)-dependent oxidoreductase [Candidatus Dormibacteraeota bacterium]|nr:SDR family NAD(P)-dependent oxidoreductase [Candidatus Dormibacteraeota bacterium]
MTQQTGAVPDAEAPVARRVALVTGCGKRDGMGQAIARTLAATGVVVVVVDRQPTGVPNQRQVRLGVRPDGSWRGLESVTGAIAAAGGVASHVLGDISDEADARRMVAHAVERHGRLDILVNNAAAPQGADRQDIEDVPVDVWDRVVSVNLRGTYLMSRHAVPVMRRQRYGRIVSISSMAGVTSAPRSTAYSASKAGILGFTRALAMDVAAWGITVNAVCPGLVWTSRAILSDDPALDPEVERVRRARGIPVGRAGQPEDVAAAVAFLASEAAGYVTGQALPVDGGGFTAFPLRRPDEVEPR